MQNEMPLIALQNVSHLNGPDTITELFNTEILCITLTVEHNYISLGTVGNTTTTCFGPIGGPF